MQAPPVHAGVAWLVEQTLPQLPQLLSVVRSVSQPFATIPSQLPHPAAQVTPHIPMVHNAPVACAPTGHMLPQVPQFDRVFSGASQPSAAMPLQFPQPASQLKPHIPAVQDGVEFGLAQALPQAPQLVVVVTDVSQPLT